MPVSAEIFSQWVEIGPNGTVTVRAITDEVCPAVMFDGVNAPMAVRSEPNVPFGNVKPSLFPVRGCEVTVPAGVKVATLDGKTLPLPRQDPKRIVVFGDTGCRIDKSRAQACNDANGWPFAKVARQAAATHPDLVLHVGDYHYREAACPAGNAGCAGSPSGYGWDVWRADFFDAAAPLLAAAPWVFVRGNHEDCSRAGEGWFRFLDRAPLEGACRDFSGMFVAKLGPKFGMVVIDAAKAEDPKNKDDAKAMSDLLRRQFTDIASTIPEETWLTTHRPFNAMRTDDKGALTNTVDNTVLDAAFSPVMPASVQLVVTGHIHFFQAVDFDGNYPPQLVVGTGGDVLEPLPPQSLNGAVINGHKVSASKTYSGYGYMVWDRNGAGWTATLFDFDGKPIHRCRLDARSLTCD